MATPLNVEVLTEMGFAVPAEAGPNDMVVAIRLDADGDLDAALAGVDAASPTPAAATPDPARRRRRGPRAARCGVVRPGRRVALVSVPGPSAFVEAMDALEAGCDVMVFSDNVPVEQELALKRYAAERSLLVMGPDCGTAVVGGLGLGFANVVSPGPVGIVAASGTGCQQVLALLDHAGVGVALRARGRRPRPVRRGPRPRHPRGDAAARRGPGGRADPARLQATGRGRRRRDPRVRRRRWRTPVEMALLGAGHPDLTEATEALLRGSGAGPGLAGRRRRPPRRPAGACCAACSSAARWRARPGSSPPGCSGDGRRATRSSTSATTPTRPAARTR